MSASDLVQALTRGLVILEHLGAADDALSLGEISRHMSLNPSTVHNLLRTLAARGFVEKTDRPTRYRPGAATRRLADQWQNRALVRRVGQSILDLHRRFTEVRFSFAEAVGHDILPTLHTGSELPGRLQRGGHPMSPYVSASSLLHQAFWPADVREAYRRHNPFNEYGGHRWRSIDHLDGYLEQIRREGLSQPHFEREVDYRVAAPVFDAGDRLVGALGAFLADAQTAAKKIPAIRQAVVTAAACVSEEQPIRTAGAAP